MCTSRFQVSVQCCVRRWQDGNRPYVFWHCSWASRHRRHCDFIVAIGSQNGTHHKHVGVFRWFMGKGKLCMVGNKPSQNDFICRPKTRCFWMGSPSSIAAKRSWRLLLTRTGRSGTDQPWFLQIWETTTHTLMLTVILLDIHIWFLSRPCCRPTASFSWKNIPDAHTKMKNQISFFQFFAAVSFLLYGYSCNFFQMRLASLVK